MAKKAFLPDSSRKLITDSIDTIYEKIRAKALGPYYRAPSGARFQNNDKVLSIPGIYSSAFQAGPAIGQQPSFHNIQSLTSVTDAYLSASREKVKAQALEEIESQLRSASVKTDYNLEKELNEALSIIFEKAQSDARQILETETHRAKTIGINDSVSEFMSIQGEEDGNVYALTRMDGKVCKYCKDFYEHDDGTPRVYKLSELAARFMDKKNPQPVLPGYTHPNCLLGGNSRVITRNGYRKIKYIKIGDEVLTHKLRWKKVINTLDWYHTPYSKDYYTIKFSPQSENGIAVTPDHQFLTEDGFVAVSELKGRKIFKMMRKCVMCVNGKAAEHPGFFCSVNCREAFLHNPVEHANKIKEESYYLEQFSPYIMYDKKTEPIHLFDLTVELDHSFVVEGMVSKNCRCLLLYLPHGFKLLPGGKLEFVSDNYDEYSYQKSLKKSEIDSQTFFEHDCEWHEPFKL